MSEWIIEVFKQYKTEIEKLKKGHTIDVTCPICKKKMFIGKSAYNGHLHMNCETCDSWMVQ